MTISRRNLLATLGLATGALGLGDVILQPKLAHADVTTAPLLLFVYLDGAWDTCLLYTSPSPRDRQKSRMPSSA